jgi:GDP-L-fucose synthase
MLKPSECRLGGTGHVGDWLQGGALRFEPGKPDGTPRKLLDVSRLNGLGWRPRIRLKDGIGSTYAWFKAHCSDVRC